VHILLKNKETLAVASKEIGLEINAGTTQYMVMSRDQNAGCNHNINTDNGSSTVIPRLMSNLANEFFG
jgi:hypothetical protein